MPPVVPPRPSPSSPQQADRPQQPERPQSRPVLRQEENRAESPKRRESGALDDRASARLRLGVLLILCGAGLYVVAEALGFILDLGFPAGFLAFPAFLGFGNWLVSGVGIFLCLPALKKPTQRLLVVATLAVFAIHFLLACIATLPRDFGELGTWWNWTAMISSCDAFFFLGNIGRLPSIGWLPLLAGLFEVVRLVLWALTLREIAIVVKARSIAFHALTVTFAAAGATVVMILIDLMIYGMAQGGMKAAVVGRDSGGFATVRAAHTIGVILNSLVLIALFGWSAFVAFELWAKVWRKYS
jgi:hypothetical protein